MIIPQPVRIQNREGVFAITTKTSISSDDGGKSAARFLAESLFPATGFDLLINEIPGESRIRMITDSGEVPNLGSEGYRLEISPGEIQIVATTPAGHHYAVQTLRQLLPEEIFSSEPVRSVKWEIPALIVEDRPRFPWRGMMLDTARHMFSVGDLKRFLDRMAVHKLNTFHWHLVDDQGWRLELQRYPRLTSTGSRRLESPMRSDRQKGDNVPYTGFYTPQEVREVVRHAAERCITVVPEIEMPGHAAAAIASYPALGNYDIPGYRPEVKTRWGVHSEIFSPTEDTFEFLQNVLGEVMEMFPSKYLHLGGDEVPKDQWKQSAIAQAVLKKNGLPDEEQLQGWFLQRMETFLHSHGRKIIGWDEIQEAGVSQSATVMIWRNWESARQALHAGNKIIMCPVSHCYFDFYQGPMETEPEAIGGNLPLETVYAFEPVPDQIPVGAAELVMGGQANLWTEYIHNASHLDYMTYPRACAMAEVLWSTRESRNWSHFLSRLERHTIRMSRLGINYRPLRN